jgi:hypothetical protein
MQKEGRKKKRKWEKDVNREKEESKEEKENKKKRMKGSNRKKKKRKRKWEGRKKRRRKIYSSVQRLLRGSTAVQFCLSADRHTGQAASGSPSAASLETRNLPQSNNNNDNKNNNSVASVRERTIPTE